MAGIELIGAHLDALAARLPPEVVDELADGLWEAYAQRLAACRDPETAARAAIADFGDPDTITAAFVRAAPWRRVAVALLATGPVMAVVWGVTLRASYAGHWPVTVKMGCGLALASIAVTLLWVVRQARAYRASRWAAAAAALGVVALDSLALIAITVVTPTTGWPAALAAAASLTRLVATARVLSTILTPA